MRVECRVFLRRLNTYIKSADDYYIVMLDVFHILSMKKRHTVHGLIRSNIFRGRSARRRSVISSRDDRRVTSSPLPSTETHTQS